MSHVAALVMIAWSVAGCAATAAPPDTKVAAPAGAPVIRPADAASAPRVEDAATRAPVEPAPDVVRAADDASTTQAPGPSHQVIRATQGLEPWPAEGSGAKPRPIAWVVRSPRVLELLAFANGRLWVAATHTLPHDFRTLVSSGDTRVLWLDDGQGNPIVGELSGGSFKPWPTPTTAEFATQLGEELVDEFELRVDGDAVALVASRCLALEPGGCGETRVAAARWAHVGSGAPTFTWTTKPRPARARAPVVPPKGYGVRMLTSCKGLGPEQKAECEASRGESGRIDWPAVELKKPGGTWFVAVAPDGPEGGANPMGVSWVTAEPPLFGVRFIGMCSLVSESAYDAETGLTRARGGQIDRGPEGWWAISGCSNCSCLGDTEADPPENTRSRVYHGGSLVAELVDPDAVLTDGRHAGFLEPTTRP